MEPLLPELHSEEEEEPEVRPASAALAELDRLYAQFSTSASSSGGEDAGAAGFPWDRLLGREGAPPPEEAPRPPPPDSFYQDPSFCSGKFSARSTSFGGSVAGSTREAAMAATRDENFSDFSKPASFQVAAPPFTHPHHPQASYVSNFSEAMSEQRSLLHSGSVRPGTPPWSNPQGTPPWSNPRGAPAVTASAPWDLPVAQPFHPPPVTAAAPWDLAPQAFADPFFDPPAAACGEQEFGGQGDVLDFLAAEEQECLQANPFIEEETCDTTAAGAANSSVFSGVSDKSIVLRNSGLWGGDTSNVDLQALRKEEEGLKVSRAEYFRHNSSRLGSLDESRPEDQRPEFGFVHNIRSPERRPCALLAAPHQPELLHSTFSLPAGESGEPSPASSPSSSGPSSSNTTYLPSGESTKTVVSVGDQSGTVKAEDLASRLESLASQLLTSAPARQAEEVQEPSGQAAGEHHLNLTTISRVLSEASLSSDPQQFVSAILGCLKRRESGVAPAASGEWGSAGEEALAAKSVPSVKPIKPFGAEGVRSPVVLPVRPQPHSEPPSREPTPAPLHKAGSLPSSLHSSALSTPGRQRRPSGARHSSPIKSAAPPSITTLSLFNTPNTDLSALLAGVRRTASPQIQHAATSHLTTSTPFHADLNLSTVILDHLTHNTSISPLVVGEAACRPTATKVSVGGELCLPPAPPVTLAEEWAAPSVYCTHCRHALDLPLHHALDAPLDVVARVTEVVVGACRLAADQWEEVVALPLGVEWRVVVGPSDTALRLPLVLRHPGVLSLTLQLATPDGGVSTGLARLRVEDANIQLLTENGGSLDFGALAEECTAEEQLMLVNCGQAEVPVHLELTTATGPFTLEGGVRAIDFVLPGVEGDGAVPGQGVARSAMVVASTVGVSAAEVTVRTAELLVGLGQDTSTLLGSLAMGVKVGRARLRTRRAEEAVELRCAPGQAAAGQVPLHNSGNIPLQLRLEVADTPEGAFTLPTTLTLEPEVSTYLNVQFTAAEGATPSSTAHTLHLSVEPRGPKHLISLHTTIITSPSKPFRSTSKPTLSFGVMKKEQEMRGEVQEFTKFPVECDKSHVNFLCVPPGGSEEQSLTLRNSTREVVTLTAITRESDRFTLMTAGGAVTSVAVELGPGMTHELRAVYRPLEVGEARGKLVLKPQGRRVGGKAFKASIGLFGLCGKTEVEMEGLERTENNIYRLVCNKFPATKVISFVNRGDFAAFIKVVPEVLGQGEAWGQVEVVAPGEVVVPRGEVRQVAVTCPAGPAALVVFRGPEVARQLMRRARQLPGAARLSDDPALLGEDMAAAVRGEELLAEGERWGGGRVATAHDVRHFYQLTSKSLVRVAVPAAPQEFGCLAVEETLSETRLEQSVVIGAHSPPTREEVGVSMSPRLLTLARGSEGVVRLANRGLATATWELVWPQAEMQVRLSWFKPKHVNTTLFVFVAGAPLRRQPGALRPGRAVRHRPGRPARLAWRPPTLLRQLRGHPGGGGDGGALRRPAAPGGRAGGHGARPGRHRLHDHPHPHPHQPRRHPGAVARQRAALLLLPPPQLRPAEPWPGRGGGGALPARRPRHPRRHPRPHRRAGAGRRLLCTHAGHPEGRGRGALPGRHRPGQVPPPSILLTTPQARAGRRQEVGGRRDPGVEDHRVPRHQGGGHHRGQGPPGKPLPPYQLKLQPPLQQPVL